MFSFTGGCRYTQSCDKFKKECIKCPAIILKNTANHNYLSNKDYLKKIDPIFLYPSKYSLEFSQKTNILHKSIKKFIFYYPLQVINKTDYISSSEINNLIYNKKKKEKLDKVVFFGAQDGREWRKGIFNLKNIIESFKIKYPDIYSKTLFIFSGNYSGNIFSNIDKNFITLGFIDHSKILELYKISDVIIIPSLQEWSSLMLLEALSLNKFIFCFNTGSSGDFIVNEINGNIFETFDYNHFHYQFYKHLTNKKNKVVSNQLVNKKILDSHKNIIMYLEKN
jgi:glycosyltransferase involved in cell wall biosynthesis